MLKGIIMEQSAKHWVVMTRDGRFLKVARGDMEGEIGAEITVPIRRKRVSPLISAAVAAVFFCLIALAGWQGWWFGPPDRAVAAYVALDINPSVELGLDRRNHVIETRGLNERGQELISEMKLKGKKVDEAVRLLIRRADEQQYLGSYLQQGAGSIVVTGTFLIEETEDESDFMRELEREIEETIRVLHPEAEGISVVAVAAPSELREEALHTGVSSGKVALKLLSDEHGQQIGWDELREMSVHDIVQRSGDWMCCFRPTRTCRKKDGDNCLTGRR